MFLSTCGSGAKPIDVPLPQRLVLDNNSGDLLSDLSFYRWMVGRLLLICSDRIEIVNN